MFQTPERGTRVSRPVASTRRSSCSACFKPLNGEPGCRDDVHRVSVASRPARFKPLNGEPGCRDVGVTLPMVARH